MKPLYQKYSIIVAAYNRKDEILELLHSLQYLDFPANRFELIIVDDGSQDGTAEAVKSFQQKAPFPIQLIQQQNQGPGPARNAGMKHATGDFFLFLDSDCTVPPHWLHSIDTALTKEKGDAFGGPDECHSSFPPLLKAINYAMTSFLTTGGIRGHSRKKMGRYYPRSFNMGLSRKLYQQIGGFSNIRHGQDIEYSHRMHKSGARIIHVPEAYVYHKRRTNLRAFFRQVFNFGVARVRLAELDSALLEPVHLLPSFALIVLIFFLFGSFFHQAIRHIFQWLILIAAGVLIVAALHGAWRYRDLKTGLLIPLVIPIQILGYGAGFLTGFLFRRVLGKKDFIGFRKRYYH